MTVLDSWLQRCPEPELMDDCAQAEAYAAADFSLSDQAFVDRFFSLFPDPGPCLVDLGCGPGAITERLAAARSDLEVWGIDGAAAMLAIAAERQAASGAGRIRFLQLGLAEAASAGPPLGGGFSAVLSNSVLHHLHDPQIFWSAVRQLAAPGACVFVRDLRRPATARALEQIVERQTVGAPEILRRDYRASLHAAFRIEEVERQLQTAGLLGWQVQPIEDRYLEVWGTLTASPAGETRTPATP